MDASEIERVVKAAEALGDYPRAVTMMRDAGIRGYRADVRQHRLVYRSASAEWVEGGEAPVPPGAPEHAFVLADVKAALRAFGRGEVDYTGFLRALWHAGVPEYEVDTAARTVTYRGRGGEAHVVHVPPA